MDSEVRGDGIVDQANWLDPTYLSSPLETQLGGTRQIATCRAHQFGFSCMFAEWGYSSIRRDQGFVPGAGDRVPGQSFGSTRRLL